MAFDWNNSADINKRFEILGWKSDGGAIVRFGITWLRFSKQSMALTHAIRALGVNEDRFLPFKTAAGEIPYHVVRTR
jgi:hypothetical protein